MMMLLIICAIFNTIMIFKINAQQAKINVSLSTIIDILHRPPDVILMTPKMDLSALEMEEEQDEADWWKRGEEFHKPQAD